MYNYNNKKKKEPFRRQIHITTMKKKDENDLKSICFGLSCDKNLNNEFKVVKMNSLVLKGKASLPCTDSSFFLIMYDPNCKILDEFYRGVAFENGRLKKEYCEEINGIQRYHFIIEYIGNYVDEAKIKLF